MAALPGGMLNEASVLSLRCFVAVVETQSFSSAARQLRLAASSVTKHVQLLESALKVALVHRTTRRISVTDAGERFYEQCTGILAQIDVAATVMTAERDLGGHLRITAPPSFVASTIGPNLHVFFAQHPNITLDLIVSSATPDLIRDRIDVAITLQEEAISKLAHFLLAPCARILCAAPSYIARAGLPHTPEDLQTHECLSSRFSEVAETWLLRERPAGDWRPAHTRSRILSDNGDLLRLACLSGVGIANLYAFHARKDLETGRLIWLLPGFEMKPKNIYAVIPHRHIVRPAARVFIEFVRNLACAASD